MIKIATANSRKAKKWTNKKVSWDEFVEDLKQPTITKETSKEYHKATKAQQGEFKDVGGFVGGWLKDGRRKAGHVELRSILSLDLDRADTDLIDMYDIMHEWEVVIYSTHSHTADEPRYRFIFPLEREVSADEYELIGRTVAEKLGMDQFDHTGFQPHRFMYWPSHSKDADFEFHHLGSQVLNPDEILNQYPDWKDISTWPMHPDETTVKPSDGKEVEDPLNKTGIIGAFCRVYSIPEAIEKFLSDIYSPGTEDNRFTYVHGSTTDGLVVYDDSLVYSHHATDPISGHAVNAFDLVRIHKFGHLDDKARRDTLPTNMPSYKKMIEYARSIEDVEQELSNMALEQASADFADELEEEDETYKPKKEKKLPPFRVKDNGQLKQDPFNLEILLQSDKNLRDKLGYNEFTGIFGKTDKFPWEKELNEDWQDDDTAQLKSYINGRYELLFGDDRIIDSLVVISQKNRYNPVKDFIRTEEWDGESRIQNLFIDYLGAADTEYVREVSELWFAAAVSRIYKPGCKFDYVPILEGAQGIGKSTLIEKLAGDWFTDSITRLDGNKDDLQLMSRVWLIELGELASLNRTEVEAAKRFISAKEDYYRAPYGRRPIVQKRNSVFMGTTNNVGYLKDITGNRRWLPIQCSSYRQTKNVFDGSLEEILHQLWAEAYELYKTKYKYGNWLDLSDNSKELAKEAQEDAEAPDVTKERVYEYLSIPKPIDWHERSLHNQRQYMEWVEHGAYDTEDDFDSVETELQTFTYSKEIYDVFFEGHMFESRSYQANSERKKIGTVLANIPGWENQREYVGGKRVRGYVKKVQNEIDAIF